MTLHPTTDPTPSESAGATAIGAAAMGRLTGEALWVLQRDESIRAQRRAQHEAARARLERCAWAGCPVCHPPDEHLWTDKDGRVYVWRLVYGPLDLETASRGAQHAQAHPLRRERRAPVPAIISALAKDGQVYTVRTRRSRPGCTGVIRIEARL